MPSITVTFAALPAHVRTARLVALATARRAGVADELLDEIRFAVGEACSRAVGINAQSGDPVVMTLLDEGGKFTVEVRDVGAATSADEELIADLAADPLAAADSGSGEAGAAGEAARSAGATAGGVLPDPLPPGFGLAVISGLVEDSSVTQGADGTRVTLSWPGAPPELTVAN